MLPSHPHDIQERIYLPSCSYLQKRILKKAFTIVHDEFEKRFDQTWLPSYGFDNTYVFLVRKDTAEKYNLRKVSDLKRVAGELKAGVDTSWITRKGDGYEGFKQAYGFEFSSILPMQVSLVYDALSAKKWISFLAIQQMDESPAMTL